MFSNATASDLEDDLFSNFSLMKNVECIIPNNELAINVRTNGISVKKPYIVYAERIDFKGLIQLRIIEKCDHRKMYISTIDTNSFNELKQDQSLNVTFSGFVDNLVKILQDCQRGVLEVDLTQNRSNQLVLQFYEMRAFKNLVHLCLPTRPAPLNVVLFYMNNVLHNLQKKTASHDSAMQCMQHELNSHLSRISQLEVENAKLRESLLENSKAMSQRHQEELHQMQDALKKSAEQRHSDSEKHMKAMSALQAQLDKVIHEKTNMYADKCQEQQKCDNLREEVAALRSNINSFKEQNEKLSSEIASLKNMDRKNEMHLNDARKHIAELQEKIKKHDKMKSDIAADLEAERKICQTKRQALEIATEEISKANEIIAKQAQELVKLKKTISWRTEVALHQEKAIKEKDKELVIRSEQVHGLQQAVENLRKDIPTQLESIKKFADSLEGKYTKKIAALSEKLSSTTAVNKENICGRRTIR